MLTNYTNAYKLTNYFQIKIKQNRMQYALLENFCSAEIIGLQRTGIKKEQNKLLTERYTV